MKRGLVALAVAVALLGLAPLASASDSSLRRALNGYKSRLTSDISYLAYFSAPSRSRTSSVLSRLSGVSSDLNGAIRAANGQRSSSRTGSRAKSLLLAAFGYALSATGYARASAYAARSGRGSSARSDARAEQGQINRAIPLFEQGGRLLHLF